MKKFILSLILLVTSVYAETTGSASILVFLNDTPLQHNEIRVDGKYSDFTDEDGMAVVVLESGDHQIEIFAKDQNGANIGYVKKQITVKESKDTQLIATFKGDNKDALVNIDTPIGEASTLQAITKFGTLSGAILSSETSKPVANARIFVKGTSAEARTDENGKFTVKIPAETSVSISVIHSEYASQTLEALNVQENATLSRQILLTPASMELEEFVVLAPKVEGSISSLAQEVKEANSITNIIGSEQMSKQGDSNAASALKRVAGITVMDGKYIYVRGLGDRYSATELNHMSLPSPNPFKRTVPLDMFPSGVIGSLQVQKTASADITSAFGGGYVNVRTKDKFNEDYAKLKLGIDLHDSYGKDAITSQGSGSDWIGKDDGYRAFDSSFVNTITPKVGATRPPSLTSNYSKAELQQIISQRSYNHQNESVPLGKNIAIEFGKKFQIDGEQSIYILGGYGYKTNSKNIAYMEYELLVNSNGEIIDESFNETLTQRNVTNIQHGGLLNIGYNYRGLDLKFTKLYVFNTLDQTRFSQGTYGENQVPEQRTYLEWQERELDTNQLTGGFDYKLFVDNRFDAGYEIASANEYVPNDIEYNYEQENDGSYQFAKFDSILSFSNRTTDDTLTNYYVKNKTILPMISDEDYIEIGYVQEDKTRESRVNKIEVQNSNINDAAVRSSQIDTIINYNDPNALIFNLPPEPKESYDASLKRTAYYLKTGLKPIENSDLVLGLRKIDLTETIEQFATQSNIVVTKNNSLDFSKTLPSLSFKYSFDKANQIKLAYTETFIYPDFREFSNTEFIHPVFIVKVAGNPDLIETDIQSYDLQYGYYFNDLDSITTSLFYKHMDNPIEDVRALSSSDLDRTTFENSSEAELYGIELSWYKNLGFLAQELNNVTFFGNYTYLDSKVTLTQEQKAKYVTSERGLQGLSPQVLNLSLMYQNQDRSLNLAYNKMAKRLMRVGIKNGDAIYDLDKYEEPPHLLDFTWIEKFKWDAINTDLDMTFKIKNILDSETTWTQEGSTTLKYKTGREYSFSISAKI